MEVAKDTYFGYGPAPCTTARGTVRLPSLRTAPLSAPSAYSVTESVSLHEFKRDLQYLLKLVADRLSEEGSPAALLSSQHTKPLNIIKAPLSIASSFFNLGIKEVEMLSLKTEYAVLMERLTSGSECIDDTYTSLIFGYANLAGRDRFLNLFQDPPGIDASPSRSIVSRIAAEDQTEITTTHEQLAPLAHAQAEQKQPQHAAPRAVVEHATVQTQTEALEDLSPRVEHANDSTQTDGAAKALSSGVENLTVLPHTDDSTVHTHAATTVSQEMHKRILEAVLCTWNTMMTMRPDLSNGKCWTRTPLASHRLSMNTSSL
jgi:hypothetical protein